MPIEILELHHCGIRVRPDEESLAQDMDFYVNVLGLHADPGRPGFADLRGAWLNAGANAQIHVMAYEGQHPRAKAPGQDPSLPHIAFGVQDIVETEDELKRMNVPYWTLDALGDRPERKQIFLADHSGNLFELHQADQCRCMLRSRLTPPEGEHRVQGK